MMSQQQRRALVGALAACLLAAGTSAWSQQAPQPAPQGKPAATGTAQKQKGSDGDAGLRQRVEQLEEQLVDLQVVIGTLESLARSGGAMASAPPAYRAPDSSGGDGRVEALETQIRALTSQVEQLSGQPNRSAGTPPPVTPPNVTTSEFGSTTVNSSKADEIGGLLDDGSGMPNNPARPMPAPSAATERLSPSADGSTGQVAAVDPAAGNPKQDYERAYGYLLQQDYGAAQAGFTDFLKQYPKDSLVPNALYWLGETHYVRKNFADASEAFDIVTQAYGSSSKAPDSQLKRGMSLAQLGRKQEACTVLSQVATKFPSAPPHVKSKADGERQRAGCP